MAKSEFYEQCTPAEKATVDKVYAELKPIHDRMRELQPYTRPLGKSSVSFEQAKAYEDEYVELEGKAAKLQAKIRKIYKRYAKFI